MLNVENLAYHYKGRPAVLKDVNFNVNTGEFLAILGNNGVGKSTMLKCLHRTAGKSYWTMKTSCK